MTLEKEQETYEAKLPELKEHQGKFVLIHGEDVVDLYSAYDDALKAGYEKFGLEPFMVKQINAMEAIQYITRHVVPSDYTRAS